MIGAEAVPSATSLEPRVTRRIPSLEPLTSTPGSTVKVTPAAWIADISAADEITPLPLPTLTVPEST